MSQLDNEFERRSVIKPEKGNDQKTKRKINDQEAIRGLTTISKLNIKIWAEAKMFTWTWYLYLQLMKAILFN